MTLNSIDRHAGIVQATVLMERCSKTIVLVLALGLSGCGDKREAHLERFFNEATGPKEPLLETIDPSTMADAPTVADRILTMSFSEVARRLGAHRFQAEIEFDFDGSSNRVALAETDLIVQAANGDFRVKVENDAGQGFEGIFSGDRFFLRNRFGHFFQHDVLTKNQINRREDAYGGFAAIYRLFRGRLSFSKQGFVRHQGREAVRFSIGLGGGQARLPGTLPSPPVPRGVSHYVYPIQPSSSEKEAYRDSAKPLEARGTLLVDVESGVLLRADFSGRLSLPAPEEKQPITLSVAARLDSSGFGNPPSIQPPRPDEVKPIPERVPADTRPLDFYFGKGFTATLGPPAGVSAPPEEKKKGEAPPNSNPGGSASKQ